jgi:hypothetical protein
VSALVTATLLLGPPRANAGERRGAVVFLEMGKSSFTTEEQDEMQAGFRIASVTPNRVSPDFALSAWLVPAIILTPDLAFTNPIAIGPDVRLVPRAGFSALLVGGGDIFGGALGFNAGLGIVCNARGPAVLRADYTARVLGDMGGENLISMHSVTVGFGW